MYKGILGHKSQFKVEFRLFLWNDKKLQGQDGVPQGQGVDIF